MNPVIEWLMSNIDPTRGEGIEDCTLRLHPVAGDSDLSAPGYQLSIVNPQESDYLVLGWVNHKWYPDEGWVVEDEKGLPVDNILYPCMKDAICSYLIDLWPDLQQVSWYPAQGARVPTRIGGGL